MPDALKPAANRATDIAIGIMIATVPAVSIRVPNAAEQIMIMRMRRLPEVATPGILRMFTPIRFASPCF
jgi:hypothetical protein